jgi:hypothetical protein
MQHTSIPFLLLLILFTCCSGNKIISPSASIEPEKIVLETTKTVSLQGNFFSFNTANLFTFFNADDATFRHAVTELNPAMLRFPGGTIANFYHPQEKGYGFRKADIKTREGGIDTNINNLLVEQDAIRDTVNFLKRFIPFAKNLNAKVIYVANILNGDISETIQALRLLQMSGLTIAYVELGNEFYLNAYKDLIPDASAYVNRAKPFAEAIRKEFPGVPLSVPAESKPHKALNKSFDWDLMLSQFSFYDAVSVHIYPDFKNCPSGKNALPMDCYQREVNQFFNQLYPDYLKRVSKLFQNKPLLITEWNIARPNRLFGNTMLHGIYTALFQLENMRLNSEKPTVQLMCFHNLASKENAYSLLTPADLNKGAPASINYTVFKMLSPLARNTEMVPLASSFQNSGQVKMYAFRASGQYHVYMVNTGSSRFAFKGFTNEKGAAPEIISTESVYGLQKDGKAVSLESYRYHSEASPDNCPPYSITHVTLKF